MKKYHKANKNKIIYRILKHTVYFGNAVRSLSSSMCLLLDYPTNGMDLIVRIRQPQKCSVLSLIYSKV